MTNTTQQNDCPASDKWNCKYCKQVATCTLHSEPEAGVPSTPAAEWRSSEGGSLVVALMHSRTWAHIAHLSVTGSGSLAMHKALNDYYDGIGGLIDRLVECAQGCYCELLTYPQETAFVAPGVVDKEVLLAYFTALNERVEQDYQGVSQPALQNIMADISELICDTKYKLMFLQ